MDEDVDFRRSLPHNYFNYMGVAFSDEVIVEHTPYILFCFIKYETNHTTKVSKA